jgi:choline-sulfatase
MRYWLACAAGVLVAIWGPVDAEAQTQRPNILLIAIDDLNDWVGPLGGHPQVQTPNMDRLAARGTTFLNAHCQSPLCNPSRTSLFTGLRPTTTGIYGLAPWFRTLPEFAETRTLPEHLQQSGYSTCAVGKIYHGGFPPAKDRGREFTEVGQPERGQNRPSQPFTSTPAGHPLMDWGPFPERDEDHPDYKIADWAVAKIQENPDEPFFLAVGFHLPHVPCYAPQRWFDMYPPESLVMPPVDPHDRDDTPEFSWYLHWQLPEPRWSWLERAEQWKPMVRAYLATISFVDWQVGRVLDALEASGQADDTIVILWSDHGWHLGEKGISGKNSLWDRSTRVPLIFAGPGIAAGARCTRPAELLDIYPTLVEMCGLPEVEHLEGHSLVPQLRDATAERPWPAITSHNQGNHGIRTERWRYIRYADGSQELYDMQVDPNEWDNLAGRPDSQAEISKLAKWLPQVDRPPAAGSAHRILTYDADTEEAVWEGARIVPAELER